MKVCLCVDFDQLKRNVGELEDISGDRHTVRINFITCVESFEANLDKLRSADAKMMQSRSRSFHVHKGGARFNVKQSSCDKCDPKKIESKVKNILELRQQKFQLKGQNSRNTEGLGTGRHLGWPPGGRRDE